MAGKKISREETDRFSGNAITSVSVTPNQKKKIAAINAQNAKRPSTKTGGNKK